MAQIQSIPMPARAHNPAFGKRGSKYDLGALRAGTDDCIVLEGLDPNKDKSKLSSAVSNYRKTSGSTAKFTIRSFTVNEDGVQKTRVGVWKTAD